MIEVLIGFLSSTCLKDMSIVFSGEGWTVPVKDFGRESKCESKTFSEISGKIRFNISLVESYEAH